LGGLIGSGLALVIVYLVISWQWAFVPLIIGLVITGIVYHKSSQEEYLIGKVSLDIKDTSKRIWNSKGLLGLIISYGLMWVATLSVLTFLPLYLIDAKGFSPELATIIFAFLFVVGMVIKPVAGEISDRVERPKVALGGLLLSIVAMTWLVFAQSPIYIGLAVVAFSVGYKAQPPVVESLMVDMMDEEYRGGDLGAAKTVATGIGALGPAYIGFVVGYASYDIAFMGLVGFLSMSALILTYMIFTNKLHK